VLVMSPIFMLALKRERDKMLYTVIHGCQSFTTIEQYTCVKTNALSHIHRFQCEHHTRTQMCRTRILCCMLVMISNMKSYEIPMKAYSSGDT